MSSPCPSTELLKQHLDGSLPEADETQLTAHLDGCASCQQTIEALAAGNESLLSAAHHAGEEQAGEEADLQQILDRLKRNDPGQSTLEHGSSHVENEVSAFLDPSGDAAHLGRLDHYEVMELVGKGGMGVVLKAFDEKLSRTVALKVMAPEFAASASARSRFNREAKSAAAVVHDHVVTIHAVDEKHRPPYLVMEFVEGKSLQGRLDDSGPLELKEILRIGGQIARGLAAAHKQGLIHRDIKPANILLENGIERVKITDFGLARAADDASITQSGVITGTPMYMSPEQAAGEHIDYRSDLFSLGSVLYAMCTGRPPFRATGTMAVMKRVIDDTPRPIREINADVPEWLCDIIAKLHAKKPKDRFASAEEVAELLEQWLAHLQQPSMVALPPSVDVPSSTEALETSRDRRIPLPRPLTISMEIFLAIILFPLIAIGTGVFYGAEYLTTTNALIAAGVTVLVNFLYWKLFRRAAQVSRTQTETASEVHTAQRRRAKPFPARRTAALGVVFTLAVAVFWLYPSVTLFLRNEGRLKLIANDGIQKVIVKDKHGKTYHEFTGNGQIDLPSRTYDIIAVPQRGMEVVGFDISRKFLSPVSSWGQEVGSKRCYINLEQGEMLTVRVEARVKEFKTPDGQVPDTFVKHVQTWKTGSPVECVAVTPDSKWVIGGTASGHRYGWSLISRMRDDSRYPAFFTSYGVLDIAVSPDGTQYAWAQRGGKLGKAIMSKNDRTFGVFESYDKKVIHCLAYAPDGKHIIAGNDHGKLLIWDVENGGKPVAVFDVPGGAIVNDVDWSASGNRIATGSADGQVAIWEVKQSAKTIELAILHSLKASDAKHAHTGAVRAVAFSPHGDELLSGGEDGKFRRWDVLTGNKKEASNNNPPSPILAIAWSPDGSHFAVGSKNKTILIFPSKRNGVWSLGEHDRGHTDGVTSLVFSPDGRYLISGSEDATIKVWEFAKPLSPPDSSTHPDHKNILGTWTVVEAWDNGQQLSKDEMPTHLVVTKDEIFQLNNSDETDEYLYKIDPTKFPKWIGMSGKTEGPWKGIYELQGDTLRFCTNDSVDGQRPDKFESRADSPNDILFVCKRANSSLPFTIVAKEGKARRWFAELKEAITVAEDGDVIEVNTDYVGINPVRIKDKSLTIRAAKGYVPTLGDYSRPNEPFFYVENKSLTLEGLQLREGTATGRTLVHSGNATLHIINCTLVLTKPGVGVRVGNSSSCEIRNCQFILPPDSVCIQWDPAWGKEFQLTVENNIFASRGTAIALTRRTPDRPSGKLELKNNTFLVDKLFSLKLNDEPEEPSKDSKLFHVRAERNIFDTAKELFSLELGFKRNGKALTRQEAEKILAGLMNWSDQKNLYPPKQKLLHISENGQTILPAIAMLSSWNKLWNQKGTGCIQEQAKFADRPTLSRYYEYSLKNGMVILQPEQFRQQPGSIGIGLGANNDWVGPGKAYERLNESPATLLIDARPDYFQGRTVEFKIYREIWKSTGQSTNVATGKAELVRIISKPGYYSLKVKPGHYRIKELHDEKLAANEGLTLQSGATNSFTYGKDDNPFGTLAVDIADPNVRAVLCGPDEIFSRLNGTEPFEFPLKAGTYHLLWVTEDGQEFTEKNRVRSLTQVRGGLEFYQKVEITAGKVTTVKMSRKMLERSDSIPRMVPDNVKQFRLVNDPVHRDWMKRIVVSNDTKKMAWMWHDSQRCRIALFDLLTRKPYPYRLVASFATSASAVSPDGKTIAYPHQLNNEIVLTDTATGKEKETLKCKGQPMAVRAIAFDAKGARLAVAACQISKGKYPSRVQVWNLKTGKEEAFFSWEDFEISQVAFSSDGTKLAITGDKDFAYKLVLWDYQSKQPVSFPMDFSLHVAAPVFLPDGKTLAIPGRNITDDLPGRIVLWDLQTNKPKSIIHEFTQQIQQIAISPNGKVLASLSMDPWESETNIRLYDMGTKKPLANLVHVIDEDVMGMAFSPDGKTLISASADEKVYTWDLTSSDDKRRFADDQEQPVGKVHGCHLLFVAGSDRRVGSMVSSAFGCRTRAVTHRRTSERMKKRNTTSIGLA